MGAFKRPLSAPLELTCAACLVVASAGERCLKVSHRLFGFQRCLFVSLAQRADADSPLGAVI